MSGCDTDPDVVHQHLVEANGSQGALDNVGDGCCSHDCKDNKEALNDVFLALDGSDFTCFNMLDFTYKSTSVIVILCVLCTYSVILFSEVHSELATPSDHDSVFLSH